MLRANKTPPVNYRRLHKLTDITLLNRHVLPPIGNVITPNVLLIVCPWKPNTTPPTHRTIRGYAQCKPQGQRSPLWRGLHLATTRNTISEAMNVVYGREKNKVRRCRHCHSFTYSVIFQVQVAYA